MLIPSVLMATGLADRLRGLLGRKGLDPGTGMLLHPCGSVHTFGMQFPIDVVYLAADWRIVRIVRHLRSCRMSLGGFRARAALEMQSGWFDFSALEPDVPVSFTDVHLPVR